MRSDALASILSLLIGCSSANAFASAVKPLDTYPSSGIPDGPDAGLFTRVIDYQEIAIPFAIPAAGHVISIETGIQGVSNSTTDCGWLLGIVKYQDLHLSTSFFPWIANQFVSALNVAPTTCTESVIRFSGDSYVSLNNLDWFLEAGQYAFVAVAASDIAEAHWYTNASVLSDEWLTRAVGGTYYYSCEVGLPDDGVPWTTLSECGIAPKPIPAIRIYFEPGLRVPEPSSLYLYLVAVALVGFGRLHRLATPLWKMVQDSRAG